MASAGAGIPLDLTRATVGFTTIAIFVIAYLQFFSYYLKNTAKRPDGNAIAVGGIGDIAMKSTQSDESDYDFFNRLARVEWNTLLFFYGVVLCVGGLGFIGYLELVSTMLYVDIGPTFANIAVGVLSAIVDNIPVMFTVLSMNPDMGLGQWLLVTLTAGVALMGQARGKYTFFGHLKWTPAIIVGYAASIMVHMVLNKETFSIPIV